MSKNSIIHLRNLIVFFIVVIIATAGAEAILSVWNNVESEEYISEEQVHKIKTALLQWEATPLDTILTSDINVNEFSSRLPSAAIHPKKSDNYPLIDSLSVTKLDKALNIVIISDSFGWGVYSHNRNEIFWRVLENNLRKEGIRANVYGVAATGANAYEEIEWLCNTTLVKDLNPDLVIFGYVFNDAENVNKIEATSLKINLLKLPDFFVNRFPNISNSFNSKFIAKTIYNYKYSNNDFVTLNGTPVLKGGFLNVYEKDFCERLDRYAADVDFPICVMTLPNRPHNDRAKALFKPLHKLYRSYKNINFYDSYDEFNRFASRKHSNNYYVNPDDGHPGSATHKFYADYILDFIRKDFPYLLKNNTGFEAKKEIIINEWLPYGISLKNTSKNSYSFIYPSADEKHTIHGMEFNYSYFLSYPLGKEHIRLNFADSINISGINAQGEYKNLQLYYTCINKELGYDDHSVYEFTTDGGEAFSVSPDIEITSVLVSAEFDSEANRNITLSFVESGGEKR